jgi:oligopeptide transport system substrate-binding protein
MKLTSKSVLGALLASSILMSPALAAGNHPVTGEALADDQTFTYWELDERSSIDPQVSEDVSGAAFVRDLFEGLYNQDADGNLVPAGALSHSVNEAGDVYTFNLRPESKWSNGDPVTAHDFVYAWQRLVDPELASPYSWFMHVMNVKNGDAIVSGDMAPEELGVRAIDDLTLEVTLEAPTHYFALTTVHGSTFPVHRATVEAHGAEWTKPENIVVNGAYILTEHVPSERTTRERNTMYWNNENTILDKVVTLVINDENVALTRYFAGELDQTGVPAGQYPKMKAEYPDQAHSNPRLCNYYYTFNMTDTTNPAFKDVRVRQALSLAVDRSIITDAVLQGGQFQAYTFTPALTAGFVTPDVPIASMTQAERDAKAMELMAEAGYGSDNPLSFSMLYNTSEGHKKIAVAMSQMWKQKLGAEVELANQEWKTFLETRGNQDFELARGAWCGDYNEASTFLDLLGSSSGYNDGKYSNARVDELLAMSKTSDNTQPLYTEIEQIVSEEVPVIPVYHYTGVMMLNPALKGWPFNNVEQNWYSKDLYKVAE